MNEQKLLAGKEWLFSLELNVHDDTKLVEVWLTNAERKNPRLQAELKALYVQCKAKKYMVAVFQSGDGDLYQSTRDLLAYNKRRCAELTARPESGGNREAAR